MGKIMLNSRQYCGGGNNTTILHRYTATLTSSQYGWFTFVDEDGNTFGEVDQKIPLFASSYNNTTGKYYTSQFVSYNNGTQYIFKVENLNGQTSPQIESGSVTVEFNLAYVEISASSSGSINYSTTEHEVGTWVDGSPIYEVSIAIATAQLSPTKYDVPAGLDKIVDMSGILWVHGTDTASLGYYVSATDRFVAYYSPSQGKIIVSETGYGNDTTGYITIRYTKSA